MTYMTGTGIQTDMISLETDMATDITNMTGTTGIDIMTMIAMIHMTGRTIVTTDMKDIQIEVQATTTEVTTIDNTTEMVIDLGMKLIKEVLALTQLEKDIISPVDDLIMAVVVMVVMDAMPVDGIMEAEVVEMIITETESKYKT